jgi:hypothetical protein
MSGRILAFTDKEWPTTGMGKHLHPYQQAEEVEQRLLALAKPHFDEFLVLRFIATNKAPYLVYCFVIPHNPVCNSYGVAKLVSSSSTFSY